MTAEGTPASSTQARTVHAKRVVIRFAGDSGDGMQLTGDRFTSEAALLGNDLATLPNYPAEIRAPAGTILGVSSFQVHFADHDVFTPGDAPDVLVAMNPAAFKAHSADVKAGGVIIANSDDFTPRNLKKVGYETSPLDDPALADHLQIHSVPLTTLTVGAVEGSGVSRKDATRSKNMFALGLVSWLYSRPVVGTLEFLKRKFAHKPEILAANTAALEAGWSFGETTETFAHQYVVDPAPAAPGTYRNITGNHALALGLTAAAHKAGLDLVLGSYPITPASDILHTLSTFKRYGVSTIQAEDEIAAVGVALGASYSGALGVTTTSGPGLALKMETISLAVSLELPLVIVDVQRGGPSTGLPTKTEQADLWQALYGRHGEAPLPVFAADSPTGCFQTAFDAVKTAITYRTPVILLSDGYIANGSEPWRVPDVSTLPSIDPDFLTTHNATDDDGNPLLHPYTRDDETGARPWITPGTPELAHRIGGLEKEHLTGNISYAPDNHDLMVALRAKKIADIDVPDIDVDDPHGTAESLVLGWGSSFGPINAACRRLREQGISIARCHIHTLSPLPANTGDVLGRYRNVVVPELNSGQLRHELQARFIRRIDGINSVRGLPFGPAELAEALSDYLQTHHEG